MTSRARLTWLQTENLPGVQPQTGGKSNQGGQTRSRRRGRRRRYGSRGLWERWRGGKTRESDRNLLLNCNVCMQPVNPGSTCRLSSSTSSFREDGRSAAFPITFHQKKKTQASQDLTDSEYRAHRPLARA